MPAAMVRVVIVDDEPLARDKLRTFLARHAGFELVGEAGDGLSAARLIEGERPDLVLLDIQMPEMDGFEVLAAVDGEPVPYIIFVTAYDRYAIQAFEVGAIDYLLKPVAPDRFDQALDRARHQLDRGAGDLADRLARALEQVAPARPPVERFLVKDQGRSRFVAAGEVEWIEAAGNYLKLHTPGGTHLVRATMKEIESRLDPARFARVHRTSIVNVDRIQYLEPWSHGDQLMVMKSGERLMLSRRYRDRLPRTLQE
jgi:two-component system, LytTR family, response regulator